MASDDGVVTPTSIAMAHGVGPLQAWLPCTVVSCLSFLAIRGRNESQNNSNKRYENFNKHHINK